MKRILVFALTIIMLCSICFSNSSAAEAGSLDNFKKQNTYQDGQFLDISSSAWYSKYVKQVYEYGLMTGSTSSLFNTNGYITIAETIAIAARVNSIYFNLNTSFSQNGSGAWYQPYVDYAVKNKIISASSYSDYLKLCTRLDFVAIMAAALPSSEFPQKNFINYIPDVPYSQGVNSNVYLFYRAGVLGGSDKYGTFNPASSISRPEVAAIITRLISMQERLTVKFDIEATGISLSSTKIVLPWLNISETCNLPYVITPSNTTESAYWVSSDPNVVTVNNGVVTGVKEGVAKITATLPNGTSDSMTFMVQSDIDFANAALKALKDLIVSSKNMSLYGVYIGTLNTGKDSNEVVVINYSRQTDTSAGNVTTFVFWHKSLDFMDGYYYDDTGRYTASLLSSSREIDLGLLSY